MINIGDLIDKRYEVVRHIGSGGSAEVFEANDLINGKSVAVKIMKESLIDNQLECDSFKEEIKIIASMANENIVEVYNEGVFNKCPYVVLEYIKEEALSKKLEYLTKFSLEEAVEIMLQLLVAVDCAHEHGLIHRDIKPQNIFYSSNGTIKLGDFGIATLEKDCAPRVLGSIQYLAPEILNGYKYSRRSDVYAAGITFYQLITGVLPFDGTTEEVAARLRNEKVQKPSKIVLHLPWQIDEIILKATKANPSERFLSAKDFRQALIDYKNGVYKKESFFSKLFKKI